MPASPRRDFVVLGRHRFGRGHALELSLQFLVGLGGGHDRAQRIDARAVPVFVEQHRQPRQNGADDEGVQIDEVGTGAGHEVFVGDVAPAGHRHHAVGDEQLVVHTPVHAVEVVDVVGKARQQVLPPGRKGVEQPDLDIGVGVQRQQQRVFASGVQVVEDQAHAHAAQRGVAQRAQQVAAGLVVVDLVVLDVERAFGAARQFQPRLQRVLAGRHQAEAALLGVLRRGLGDAAERRFERRRGALAQRAIYLVGKLGATSQNGQREKYDQQAPAGGAPARGGRHRRRLRKLRPSSPRRRTSRWR